MPHESTQRRPRPFRQVFGRLALVGRALQPDLDQLVDAECVLESGHDCLGNPPISDLDDRLQLLGSRPQPALLETLESASCRRHARGADPNQRIGWAPVVSRSLLLILLGAFASACASLPSPDASSVAYVPATQPSGPIGLSPSGWERLSPGAARSNSSIELPDDFDERLTTTMEVLAEKGPELDALAREGVARALVRGERIHGLSVFLMLGVMEQESRFDPDARGPSGALGLMQVRPFVGRDVARRHRLPWYGDGTLRDPVHNVQIALTYMAELQKQFGTPELALAAYHIGPTRTRRRLTAGHSLKGPYVTRVLGRSQRMSGAFDAETATGG
jgi:hypothetical protein